MDKSKICPNCGNTKAEIISKDDGYTDEDLDMA